MNAQEAPFTPEGPQPLVRDVAPGAPYPVTALGPLRAAVEAVQGMTQAPMALPAQSALAVASLAVQAFADVETLGGPRPMSLYCLTVARSGERKSACDTPFIAALRTHEREQGKAQRDAFQSWQNALAIWKGRRESILADAKKGKGEKRTAAEADLAALGPEPAAPPSVDRTVSEPTFEGLTKLFAHGQPSLGIFSDEGGQFLGGHAMNSDNRQKTLAALNDLWQGNPIRRTRGGDGHLTLYGRRLAVHLMVQPTVALTFMADPLAADTGFLPRFLICEPPSTIGTRLSGNARSDPFALASFATRLGDIAPAARTLLEAFSDAIEAAQGPGRDLAGITGTASKTAEQAARIAGVLTLWRDLDAREVLANDMRDAIILAQFYLTEARRLAEAGLVSLETAKAEALRVWLAESWPHEEILPAEILQKGPNALRERKALDGPLAMLAKAGHLLPLEAGTIVRGAARKEAYRILRGA
jgi:hypothetical protein